MRHNILKLPKILCPDDIYFDSRININTKIVKQTSIIKYYKRKKTDRIFLPIVFFLSIS